MGLSLVFAWFGKSVTELKAIKERDWNKLSLKDRERLDNLIAKKEKNLRK